MSLSGSHDDDRTDGWHANIYHHDKAARDASESLFTRQPLSACRLDPDRRPPELSEFRQVQGRVAIFTTNNNTETKPSTRYKSKTKPKEEGKMLLSFATSSFN